jgi:hypothetical protein
MTLANIAQGEVVTVRIYKQYVGFSWANNYEVQATTNINDPAQSLAVMVDRLVDLEKLLHLQGVIIDRATVSSYAPDSQPYNPDTLTTFPYSVSGQRQGSSEVLPLELCLFVRRNVNFGRDGRLLYRGCLTENDMVAASFRPLLASSTVNSLQNAINTWFQQGIGSEWVMVMASGTPQPTGIRRVVGSRFRKDVCQKVNNRYFRRRP